MASVDLRKRNAAKAESAKAGHHTIVGYDGTEWRIAGRFTLSMSDMWANNDIRACWFSMLDESQHEEFKKSDPPLDDIVDMFEAALDLYGMTAGERQASTES